MPPDMTAWIGWALTLAMGALGLSIALDDWRTTYVRIDKLVALVLLGLLFPVFAPLSGTSRAEHILGGVLLLGIAVVGAWWVERRVGRPATGGADHMILAAGGFALGAQWIGPWVIMACLLGGLGFALGGGRKDVELDDGRAILPFGPMLLSSFLLVLVGRMLGWLPPYLS